MITFLRYLDITLATMSVSLLLWVNRRPVTRLGQDEPEVIVRVGFGILLVSTIWGGIESLAQSIEGGSRSIVLTVALVYIAIALFWMANRQRKEGPKK